MPYTKVYLGHFNNHFSTIGICGMHEACLNFLGKGIGTPEGKDFAIEILNFMRGVLREYQEETGQPLQPRGHAGRVHLLPAGPAGQAEVSTTSSPRARTSTPT